MIIVRDLPSFDTISGAEAERRQIEPLVKREIISFCCDKYESGRCTQMGWFTKLFQKKPVVELRDPAFGLITFARGIWTFLPTKGEDGFMIGVDAPETGPTERQRVFFCQVLSELAEYERHARDYMASRVQSSVIVSQLSTYSVQIEDDDATLRGEFTLEMSDDDALIVHRVSFRNGQPIDYGFDD